MFRTFGKAGALIAGVALAACSGGSETIKVGSGSGSVNFDLSVPGLPDDSVNSIELKLMCPGVDNTHTLNVTNNTAIASFGGLPAPAECTASMSATSAKGTLCQGSTKFNTIAGQNVPVVVTLICQGVNTDNGGGAKIEPKFEARACTEDRIKKVYAIPSNLLLGESTLAQVELTTAIKGTPSFTWGKSTEATNATGALAPIVAPEACDPKAAACQKFTCEALGATPSTDPRTGLPTSGIFVTVQVKDDECYDTEQVWIDCLQSSVCGDGTKSGTEQCDDGNVVDNDGCSASCKAEICGDNIKQTNEQCDGSAPAGFTCNAQCQLVEIPAEAICGDGAVNQPSEQCDGQAGLQPGQVCGAAGTADACKIVPTCGNGILEGTEVCDGTAGLQPGQQCTATCTINAVCGNGIKEGAEQCDDGNTTGNDTCSPQCTTTTPLNACEACLANNETAKPINDAQCANDPLCVSALKCITDNQSCWDNPVPTACYCGSAPSDIENCENPTFVPSGPCVAPLKAGAGPNAANADVVARFFDFAYPMGIATVLADIAYSECNQACFGAP